MMTMAYSGNGSVEKRDIQFFTESPQRSGNGPETCHIFLGLILSGENKEKAKLSVHNVNINENALRSPTQDVRELAGEGCAIAMKGNLD